MHKYYNIIYANSIFSTFLNIGRILVKFLNAFILISAGYQLAKNTDVGKGEEMTEEILENGFHMFCR